MQQIDTFNLSLLALACGDSYGSFYEFEGLYGVRFSIRSLPKIPKRPNITDDTKMATILLKHYKTHKTIEPELLLNAYKQWAINDGNNDGIGLHTYAVLVNDKEDKNSQGNGALMRVIPFGLELVKDGYSFEEALSLMNQDSALTHDNETIFMANKIALDIALNGIEVVEKTCYKKFMSSLHLGDTAWVKHSLFIVIQALQKKRLTFAGAFRYIVSYGGDTDTNCAIYGALRGFKEDIRESLHVEDFLTIEMLDLLKIEGF